jgi:hypothetical protein
MAEASEKKYYSEEEYVLVSQKEPMVEVFTRQDDKTWLYHIAIGLEANITLHSLNHEIQLLDIYRKIDFTVASE